MKIKRFISALLAGAMLAGVATFFPSCSGAADDSVTVGEWLAAINDAFGITYYTDEKPVEGVSASDPYYDAVQAALDWDIIDGSALNTGDKVTKLFAANTLVKAVGFADVSAMTSDEIARFAADNGYVDFEYRGQTDGIRYITAAEGACALAASADIWYNPDFGELKEEIKLNEGTVDLTSISSDKFAQADANTFLIDKDAAADIAPGTIYILPGIGINSAGVYKAESVEYKDNYAVITNSAEEVKLEDAVESFTSSGSVTPDLTTCVVVDGLGNVVSSGSTVAPQSNTNPDAGTMNLVSDGAGNVSKLADGAFTLDLSIGDIHINGTVSPDYISVSADGILYKGDNGSMSFKKSYEIRDIGFDQKIQLFNKYAYAKLNYTTVDTTKLDFSYDKTVVFAPEYSNGNGHFLSNLGRSVAKDANAKGAKSIKICSVKIADSWGINVWLEVKLNISIDGQITLTVTTRNSQGAECRDGKVRFFKDQNRDVNINADCKAEATLYLGLKVQWFDIPIFTCGIEGGLGCVAKMTAHLADSERHLIDEAQFSGCNMKIMDGALGNLNGMSYTHDEYGVINLTCESCIDITTYAILRFVIDPKCFIGGFLNGNTTITFLDINNAVIPALCVHIEDGHIVDHCTRTYNDGEETSDSSGDETAPDETAFAGVDAIDVDFYFLSLSVGENGKLNVTELPEGYTMSDVVFSSGNSDIVSVSGDGTLKAVSGGQTEITVKTSDEKYTVSCSVFVADNAQVSFSAVNLPA